MDYSFLLFIFKRTFQYNLSKICMTITLYKLEIFSKLVLSEEVRDSKKSIDVSLVGEVRDSINSIKNILVLSEEGADPIDFTLLQSKKKELN